MCLEDNEIIESIEYNESAKDYVKSKTRIQENIEKIEEAIEELSCLMDYEEKEELRSIRQNITRLKKLLKIERGKHN